MELAAKAVIGLIEGLIVISHLGQVLGLVIFPVYAIVFLVRLKRRQFDRLRHFTMILFTLAFVLSALIQFWVFAFFGASSRQAEAKTSLGAIYTLQLVYHAEFSEYARGPDCFKILGWAPEGNTIYSLYCDQDLIPAIKPILKTIPPLGDHWPPGVPKPEGDNTSFRVMAIGNIDGDEYLDVWTMDESKNLSNVINDVANVGAKSLSAHAAIRSKLTQSPYTIHQIALGLLTPILIGSLVRDWRKWRRSSEKREASIE